MEMKEGRLPLVCDYGAKSAGSFLDSVGECEP